MKKSIIVLLLIPLMIMNRRHDARAAKDEIGRYAVVIGSNDGGLKRARLQYAVSDAASVSRILREMGGVLPENGLLLVDPGRQAVISGLKTMQEKIKNSGSFSRTEFIFYYSGHSDEEAILLGKEKITYKDIREYINDIRADLRIAILDSCSSGALTRLKGGKLQSPFLSDASFNMKGYACMTSSSSDEASQESDRIKGSYFTHYLISGLRGAADINQDRCITLSEAYQFAYNETIAGTEKTISGPQHPNRELQLSGTGDVIITDIRRSSAVLIISEDISGRLFIRDKNNNLVCELKKPSGRAIQFGLEDGAYTVTSIREGKIFEASVELAPGKQAVLAQNDLKPTEKEYAVSRGDANENEKEYKVKEWDFSLVPDMKEDENTIHHYSFNLFGSYSAKLEGFSFGLGPGLVRDGVKGAQVNIIGNYAAGSVKGAQVSYIFDIAGEDVTGFQGANTFNYAGRDVTGSQVSSLSNVAGGNMTGAQVSCIFNYTGGLMKGAQISAVCNKTAGEVKGVQLSAITNISDNVKGMQISLVNIADDFKGLQLGLVNISDTQSGLPIGLINISRNGGIDIMAWGSSLMAGNMGIMFRANYIYTIISAGWMNLEKKINESFSYGFNMGVHIPAKSFFIDIDAGKTSIDNKRIFSSDNNIDQQYLEIRLLPGYHITKKLSLFAGVGISYRYDGLYKDEDNDFKNGKFGPLFFAGIRYSLYGNK